MIAIIQFKFLSTEVSFVADGAFQLNPRGDETRKNVKKTP